MRSKCVEAERVVLTLSNGVKIQGSFVRGTKSNKFFIKTLDGKRELCIPNFQSGNTFKFSESAIQEVNDFMLFLREQAKLEFPEWIKQNGRNSKIENPLYNLKELEEEWKSMKSFFGKFRIAGDCGFFSDKHPLKCKTFKVVNYFIKEASIKKEKE